MKKKIISILLLSILTIHYSSYVIYKQNLINKYGESTFVLMNQEANIKNELQSYLHYIIYNI